MNIPEKEYERIATMIHSDSSPVGIDAKKTHIMLLYMMEQMQAKIDEMERRLATIEQTN